jgi:hypothetical protein
MSCHVTRRCAWLVGGGLAMARSIQCTSCLSNSYMFGIHVFPTIFRYISGEISMLLGAYEMKQTEVCALNRSISTCGIGLRLLSLAALKNIWASLEINKASDWHILSEIVLSSQQNDDSLMRPSKALTPGGDLCLVWHKQASQLPRATPQAPPSCFCADVEQDHPKVGSSIFFACNKVCHAILGARVDVWA